MKSLPFVLVCALGMQGFAASGPEHPSTPQVPSTTSYLFTNDDLPGKAGSNGSTVFPISANGLLGTPTRVSLGGTGGGGGYFDAARMNLLQGSSDGCAFGSIAASGEIGAIDINAMEVIGDFYGGTNDSGQVNGIGLVNNGTYLYANFTGSNTIATFAIQSGCTLNFLGDVSALGMQSGNVKGMAVHQNILVVAYGDGSIESFNVSGGIPVSNGDLQNTTGFSTDQFAIGVDITADGHYAIFGDQSVVTAVEVSDISSGKLTKTKLYKLGTAANSANIYLSPDETLLYIANTGSGQLTAAFFNAATGALKPGCTSPTLKKFDNTWIFLSSPVTELNTGTGSVVYMAEYGSSSGIAVVNVASSGGKCTLTEAAGSPVLDPNSTTLLSIGVYPPRSF
ncbi:MAG TPA: beta-propeller fold lactonase family protein [Verrucomicrobiae bacterium]|jgi:hypothetical protein|nr:beta-propeller fold lactonase family protein [Verrucomicrobiae bacterium]